MRTDPASQTGHELTSQLYFDDALCDSVHAKPPSAEKHGKRDTTNSSDGIFRRGGRDLMLQVTPSGEAFPPPIASGS